jgi:HK97 family phage major capsid protein
VEWARDHVKQLVTSSTGVLIPESFQTRWIDLIRANMVLREAGMSTVVMDAKTVNFSRVAGDPVAAWHTEAATITPDEPTFEAASLVAQTLVCRCTASVEVSQDSPDFGEQLAGVMAAAMAVELDRVGLVGSGTPPEPKGILGTSGVNQVTSIGAMSSYAKIIEGVGKLLGKNISLADATRVMIMSPGVWAKLEGLVTGISSDKTQLPLPRALQGTCFLVTSAEGLDDIHTTPTESLSTAFIGRFADLVLGVRREASVEVLKLQSYADKLILEFIGYLRGDYLVRRPYSFCTLEGIEIA